MEPRWHTYTAYTVHYDNLIILKVIHVAPALVAKFMGSSCHAKYVFILTSRMYSDHTTFIGYSSTNEEMPQKGENSTIIHTSGTITCLYIYTYTLYKIYNKYYEWDNAAFLIVVDIYYM